MLTFQFPRTIILVISVTVLLQCIPMSRATTTPDIFSTQPESRKAIASSMPAVVVREKMKNTNPYDDNSRKKKQNTRVMNKNKNRLVVNIETCRDISYQLAQQWDPSISQSPSSVATTHTTTEGVPLALSLASITSHCLSSSFSTLITLNNTIDLVCHIRLGIHPKITMVTLPRCLATAWLTLAALKLPREGAIVETGTWRGGMSILSLLLIKRHDHCAATSTGGGGGGSSVARKFWAFDS